MKHYLILLLSLISISSLASDQATDYKKALNSQTTKYNLGDVKNQNIKSIYCDDDTECVNKMTNPEEKKYYTNSDSATEQVHKSQALIDAGKEAANDSIAMEIVNDRYNQPPVTINPDDFGFSRYAAVVDNADAIASGTGNKYIDCETGDSFKYIDTERTCNISNPVIYSCTKTPYIEKIITSNEITIRLYPTRSEVVDKNNKRFYYELPVTMAVVTKALIRKKDGTTSNLNSLPIYLTSKTLIITTTGSKGYRSQWDHVYIDLTYKKRTGVLGYKNTCPQVESNPRCKVTYRYCSYQSPSGSTFDGYEVSGSFCLGERINYSCGTSTNSCSSLTTTNLPQEKWKENDTFCVDKPNTSPICLDTIDGKCVDKRYTKVCTKKENVGKNISCATPLPCANGECDTPIIDEQKTSFNEAASNIMALTSIGQYMDEDGVTFFTGKESQCSIKAAGFSNCCKESGWGQDVDLAQCSTEEKEIIIAKENKELIELGSYCAEKVLGVCIRKKRSFCQYTSKIAQILMEQGKPQLGLDFGSAKHPDCSGITIEQMQNINFDILDFSNMFEDVTSKYEDNMPSPDAIQQRIKDQVKTKTENN